MDRNPDYTLLLSYHTHATGAQGGWFGSVVHPGHLDSEGQLVMGTEWRDPVDRAHTLEDVVYKIDQIVNVRMKVRGEGALFPTSCLECGTTMMVVAHNRDLPLIIHPEKRTGNHAAKYELD